MSAVQSPKDAALWYGAGLIVIAVTVSMLVMTPAIEGDHTWGILASEQALLGRSSNVRQIVVADPHDLGRDRIQAVTWSAPGHQEVIYALRRVGLSLGASLKAAVVIAWSVGIVAWAAYFVMALDDKRLAPWLVAAFACFRMSHYHAFVYVGGDMLLWAAFPLAVVANLQALRGRGVTVTLLLAAVAGALSGSLIVFKYSAVFLSMAAAMFVAFCAAEASVLGCCGRSICDSGGG